MLMDFDRKLHFSAQYYITVLWRNLEFAQKLKNYKKDLTSFFHIFTHFLF